MTRFFSMTGNPDSYDVDAAYLDWLRRHRNDSPRSRAVGSWVPCRRCRWVWGRPCVAGAGGGSCVEGSGG